MRKDKSKTDNMHSFSGSKYHQMQKTRKPASRDGLPVCIFSRRPLSPADVQRSIERPRRFSSILLRFQVPHRPPLRFVCSHQTIVCCRQTIVCSHQTIVCSHQTIVCCHQTIVCSHQTKTKGAKAAAYGIESKRYALLHHRRTYFSLVLPSQKYLLVY